MANKSPSCFTRPRQSVNLSSPVIVSSSFSFFHFYYYYHRFYQFSPTNAGSFLWKSTSLGLVRRGCYKMAAFRDEEFFETKGCWSVNISYYIKLKSFNIYVYIVWNLSKLALPFQRNTIINVTISYHGYVVKFEINLKMYIKVARCLVQIYRASYLNSSHFNHFRS